MEDGGGGVEGWRREHGERRTVRGFTAGRMSLPRERAHWLAARRYRVTIVLPGGRHAVAPAFGGGAISRPQRSFVITEEFLHHGVGEQLRVLARACVCL